MAAKAVLRDNRLIDALEASPLTPFDGIIWRVVREGRDPQQYSASGGRWDDGSFDVLYTSTERDGAIAEMYFHLLRGQPVSPSKARFTLHELRVSLTATFAFPTLDMLAVLGMDVARYGQLSYVSRQREYPRSQEIAEVAHFLECDGIVVPNARWPCLNVVLFCDAVPPDAIEAICDYGLVDWTAWQKSTGSRPVPAH